MKTFSSIKRKKKRESKVWVGKKSQMFLPDQSVYLQFCQASVLREFFSDKYSTSTIKYTQQRQGWWITAAWTPLQPRPRQGPGLFQLTKTSRKLARLWLTRSTHKWETGGLGTKTAVQCVAAVLLLHSPMSPRFRFLCKQWHSSVTVWTFACRLCSLFEMISCTKA